MQGHGSVLPILGQRSGHVCRLAAFYRLQHRNGGEFSGYPVLHPECSFLDESLSERIAMRAIQSDSELRGIYLTSAGREGVYRAVAPPHIAAKSCHIVVHEYHRGNIKWSKRTVDFIIGQDVKTQGTLPIRLLYDYLDAPSVPKSDEYDGYYD